MLKSVGERRQYTSWGRLVAACGLIGVAFNHRASQEFTRLQDPAEDIDDVVRYLRTQVREVDIERLGIWVCSAGGSYGLRTAYRVHTSSVRCVVAYYAMSTCCWMPLREQEIKWLTFFQHSWLW